MLRMRLHAWLSILLGLLLAGCGAARTVAVTSFRVLDAPAAFVRKKLDPPQTTTTTTVQRTQISDVSTPGRPVVSAPPTSTNRPRTVVAEPSPKVVKRTPPKPTAPAPTASASTSAAVRFPTAKPVPGKPGYVYSVDPKGGIVDVTGYKSGDKAKDPYTQQIFIVP